MDELKDVYETITITVDFDNTLSRLDVQEYVKELINLGIDVNVLTMRYDELHKHKWTADPTNDDLYAVLDNVGIPRHKVRFCNMEGWDTKENNAKAKYLRGTNVLLHIDDSVEELKSFELYDDNKVVPIQVEDYDWKFKCGTVFANYVNEYNRKLWDCQDINQIRNS
jgi:DNA-directed RNA polymerase subunit N (RpoN/RPB10)